MIVLENDNLIVEVKRLGAELTRIYSKKDKREILWCGDTIYWGRHSPILFPIVGRLKDNKAIIENRIYEMNQHGFARDMEFEIIEIDKDSVTYVLSSNDKTKSFYPYEFKLVVRYVLKDSFVKVEWKVINKDNKEIYFSIGGHPAFNLELSKNQKIENYSLKFKSRGKVKKIQLNGAYYENVIEIDDIKELNLTTKIFKDDALIYTNIDEVSLINNLNKEILKVELDNFPLVGIWSPYYRESNKIAPFICIEPWYGLADSIDSDHIYNKKMFMNKLNIGEEFFASYKICIK